MLTKILNEKIQNKELIMIMVQIIPGKTIQNEMGEKTTLNIK